MGETSGRHEAGIKQLDEDMTSSRGGATALVDAAAALAVLLDEVAPNPTELAIRMQPQ